MQTILYNTHMMTGNEIRAIRAFTRMTQAQFGSKFGVTRTLIAYWETWGIVDNPLWEKRLRALREAQDGNGVDGGTGGGSEATGG